MHRLIGWIGFLAVMATGLLAGVATADTPRELSLDGPWRIVFDENNEGRAGRWQDPSVFESLPDRREINVPCCWETIEQDYEGVAFYGRTFDVPKAWEGKVVRVQFDAVNYIAEVWVNGYCAGRHEGGYGPFELRIDDFLKFDAPNFISLRVVGPIVAQDKVVDGLGWSDMPHWRGAIAGGIWQSVRLVASGPAYIKDVAVTAFASTGMVQGNVDVENTAPHASDVLWDLRIDDVPFDSRSSTQSRRSDELTPGEWQVRLLLRISDVRCWSPDDPHLYTLHVVLRDAKTNEILDAQDVRFGMREFTINNNRFELNGKPIYIKAAFFEGLYPTNLASPDGLGMARREIQLAQDADFNMIRPWRKPPPPAWLDLCDEMGMLVVGSMPIECMNRWPTVTPRLRERIENEVTSAVLRDRNRACIVQWEIFNEIHRKELERLKHPMSLLARRLDPTRLILDESGGFAGGSAVYLPGEYEPIVFNDVHSYPGAPVNDAAYDNFLALSRTPEELEAMGLPRASVRSRTTPGRMTVVSEIGYGSLPDLVDNNERFARDGNPITPPYRYHKQMAEWIRGALQDSGLDEVYPDLRTFCLDQQAIHSDANKRMIEAIRSNDRTCGYAVHALTDGDWVLGAGLLDLFRNPKLSYEGTKEANAPQYLALQVRPRNVYADRGSTITVTGINDLESAPGTLVLEVVDADGKEMFRSQEATPLASGVSELFARALDASSMSGAYEARVRFLGESGDELARNRVPFDVYDKDMLTVPAREIAILDTANALRPFLRKVGIAFQEFGPETPPDMPVFVAKADAPTPEAREQFTLLERFVELGGTAVYLNTIQWGKQNQLWGARPPARDVLPFEIGFQNAWGLWVGVSHIVTDHPVFRGLPTKCMMGRPYENVYARHTIQCADVQPIVGAVSHGWHQGDSDKQNYLGPSSAWWGADMGVVPHGRGRYILTSMRITENLGKDPVADKILFNLIDWTTGNH